MEAGAGLSSLPLMPPSYAQVCHWWECLSEDSVSPGQARLGPSTLWSWFQLPFLFCLPLPQRHARC